MMHDYFTLGGKERGVEENRLMVDTVGELKIMRDSLQGDTLSV